MKKQKKPPEVFYKKKLFFKNFAKFTGKHLCQNLFLIKLQAWDTFFTEYLRTSASKEKHFSDTFLTDL